MNILHFTTGLFDRVVAGTLLASILGLLVVAIQTLIGRRLGPAWRHALWLIVLLRLIVPIFPESRFSLFNAPRWLQGTPKPEPGVKVRLFDAVQVPPRERLEYETSTGDFPLPAPAATAPLSRPRLTLRQTCGLLWLSGSLALLVRLAIGSAWLRIRLARNQLLLDPTVVRLLSEARWRMRTFWNPRPIETSCVDSPGLFGILRPRILLPPNIAQQLSETELRHIFLHELAHLKRGDLWVNLLMSIVHVLHWFNPLVWFILRRMRLERELACDALVLRATPADETHVYGETILKLLDRITPRPALTAVVGILEEKQSAASRLQQIAQFESNKTPSRLLGVALLSLLALVGLSNAQTQKRAFDAVSPGPPDSDPPTRGNATGATNLTGLDILQKEYAKQRTLVEDLQKELEDLRVQFKLSGNSSSESEIIRTLEHDLAQAHARHVHFQKIYDDLSAKSRKELRKVMPTAAPDVAMDRYLGDLAKLEQEYASNVIIYGPQQSEILKLEAARKTIDRQIEDRIDGVLAGLELEARQTQALVDELQKRLEASKEKLKAETGKEHDAYFLIKRKLDNEQRNLDTLYLRLLQEKIDAKVPRQEQERPQASAERPSASSVLVQDARHLMEMGKLDEAEAKLRQALTEDPDQRAPSYYLQLIKERRFAIEARQREAEENRTIPTGAPEAPEPSRLFPRDSTPLPNPYRAANRPNANPGRATINRKLDAIILQNYEVQGDLELSEVIKDLQRRIRELDANKVGVNMIISSFTDKPPRGASGDESLSPGVDPFTGQPVPQTMSGLRVEDYKITIDPALRNVSLRSVLDAIVRVASPPEGANQNVGINYSIEDYAVVFHREQPPVLWTRTYRINPEIVQQRLGGVNAVRTNSPTALEALRNYLITAGAAVGVTVGGVSSGGIPQEPGD
jgi:beta-lactamase regulating signal transducer with metallopeptidase domain